MFTTFNSCGTFGKCVIGFQFFQMHGTFKSNKGMRQALNGLFWRASPGPHGCLRKRRLSFCDMIVYQHTVTYINSCYFYANIKMQSRVPADPISKCLKETSTIK